MTRQTSKGTCTFCQTEYSKAGMTRHLETCKQRATLEAAQENPTKGRKGRHLHVQVEGRSLPMYWLHLDIPASATLEILDQFLRDIWLECCGHLSAFEIEGVRYNSYTEMYDADWGMPQKNMRTRLDKALKPGQRCSYEYDFGSTTELIIKVISEREARAGQKDPIQVLARNTLPSITCDGCGKPATSMCSECLYDEKGYLCDTCAEEHSCGEEMLLPIVNSPRAGVCAYAG